MHNCTRRIRTESRRRPMRGVAIAAAAATAMAASACGGASSASGAHTTLHILIHSNPGTNSALQAIDSAFEKANPKITVELSTVPTNNFAQTQSSRVAAGSVDVTEGPAAGIDAQSNPSFVTGAQPDFVTGVRAGDWVDLTNEPFMKNFSTGVLKQLATDGKQYAVPSGADLYTGVFYNKTTFAKYGLSVPTTWQQFENVCQTLDKAGVMPMTIGGKDTWPAGLPMLGVAQSLYSTTAMQQLDQGLWTKTASLSDATSIKVLDRVKAVYACATPTFPGVSETEATSAFTSGQAAMWPDGTWNAAAIVAAAPNLQFGYFPLPASDDASQNATLGGKLDFSFAIPKSSKHQNAAKAWLAFYAQKPQYQLFIKSTGFIPAESGVTTTSFNDSIQKYLGTAGFTPAWDQIFHPNSKSGDLSIYPWAYPSITPMGKAEDMTSLAAQMQANWNASLSS